VNVLSAKVALRDRSLLDVLDLSVRFVVAHVRAYFLMSAVVSVPGFLVSWLAAVKLGWLAGWATAFALVSFAEAPYVVLASRLVFEEEVPTGVALAAALRALPRLLGFRLLQITSIVSGAFFFLIPGVWVAALFLFGTEVIVLEQSKVGATVGRMQRLGTGFFGDVLMAMLALCALYIVAVVLGDQAGHAILEQLLQIKVRAAEDEIGGPIALFALWMAVPTLTTARLFVYLNLRTRREGWDIQTRFAALAARARVEAEEAGVHA
jgi:hypothetical protein